MTQFSIPVAIEDVPFVSALVRDQLIEHAADFDAYSPIFGETYIADYDASASTVEKLVSPLIQTGELKLITKKIKATYKQLRNVLNDIEFYVEYASGELSMASYDFPIKPVRDQISRKNDEGAVLGLKTLDSLLTENAAPLAGVGYTTEKSQELKDLIKELENASLNQTRKAQERAQIVKDNGSVIEAHWKMIRQVCDAGKRIGRRLGNKLMVKAFTMTELKKKVRQQRKTIEEKDTGGEE